MSDTFSPITLMMAVDKPQQKTFSKDGNRQIQSTNIHPNASWGAKVDNLKSLPEMFEWFKNTLKMKNAPHFAVMRGQWLPDSVLDEMEARRQQTLKEHEGEAPPHLIKPIIYREKNNPAPRRLRRKALLTEQPLHWICIDFDGAEVEGIPFSVDDPFPAVNAAIKSELGEEFAIADYILQLSSSAGVKDGICAHCWFWLEKPFTGAHWNAWFKARTEILGRKPFIDKAMFGIERIHYIVPPVFKPADLDPLKGKERWLYFEGFDSCVCLKVPEITEEKPGVDYFDAGEMDAEEAADAWGRPGIVGVFNRCYSMSETIQTFLPNIFRIDNDQGRVTWLERSSEGGCKIFAGNTKMVSTHQNSDPFECQPRNAFDHIQQYLFDGDYAAAAAWAEALERCVIEKERAVATEFDDILEPAPVFSAKIDSEKAPEKKTEILTPEKIAELYPMPDKWMKKFDTCYRLTKGGWRFGYMREDEDTGKKTFIELWSPITIWNRDISIQTKTTSLHVKLMGHDGAPLDVVLNRGETVSKAILGHLWGSGWNASNQNGEAFVDFLRSQGDLVNNTRLVSSQRGWFTLKNTEGQETRVFAAPSGKVYMPKKLPMMDIALRPDWVLEGTHKGTLEGWKGAVRDLCRVDNVPHWILGVASGLVGPLMELYEGATPGIVFGGDTSRGKTTALRWAASAWSAPDERKGGMMKSLRTTANAVESLAASGNSTVLLLDETNLIDGRLLEGVVYTIASGTGKQRLRVDGSVRENLTWSTFVLMSGEAGLAQRFESASGKKMGKGASVRLLDFDVSNVNAAVPTATISKLREQIFANHGWAGEAFVEKLIESGFADETRELWAMRKDFKDVIAGSEPVGVVDRAADILSALKVAVELALQWEILPDEFREKFDEAISLFWTQVIGGVVFNSHQTIMDQIQLWINAKWDRSVVEIGSENGVRDIEAWYDDTLIYLPPEKLIEATGGVSREAEIKRALDANEVVEYEKNGSNRRFISRRIPGIGPLKHIRLIKKAFRESNVQAKELAPEDIF